jgi:hypothetical protein
MSLHPGAPSVHPVARTGEGVPRVRARFATNRGGSASCLCIQSHQPRIQAHESPTECLMSVLDSSAFVQGVTIVSATSCVIRSAT